MNTLNLFVLREQPTGKYLSGKGNLYLDQLVDGLSSEIAVYKSQKNAEKTARDTFKAYDDHVKRVVENFKNGCDSGKEYWQKEFDRKIEGIEIIPIEFKLLEPISIVRPRL